MSELPTRRKLDSTDSEELFYKTFTIEADTTIIVNIWMEHFGQKFNIWRFGGVFLTEIKFELKESSIPSSSLRSFNKGSPLVKIAFFRWGIDPLILLIAQLLKIPE